MCLLCRWVKQLGAGRVPSDWGNIKLSTGLFTQGVDSSSQKAARWVPHLLSDDQKQQRVACSHKLLFFLVESWLTFYGIPNKRCNRIWVGPDGDRPVVLRPGFQSRKRLFSIFFNTQGLWQLTFCLRNQQSLPPTIPKLCSLCQLVVCTWVLVTSLPRGPKP